MEKKNTLYACPYCKKEHETPGSLARCILVCEDKIKMEEEAKLAAEKDARYQEVVHAYENFEELRSKYVEDYGRFTFKTKSNDEEVCDFILKSFGLM